MTRLVVDVIAAALRGPIPLHRTADPQEWEIASAHSSGYPGSGLYRGRRIRKDGQPSDRPATALYPTRILGPAPAREKVEAPPLV